MRQSPIRGLQRVRDGNREPPVRRLRDVNWRGIRPGGQGALLATLTVVLISGACDSIARDGSTAVTTAPTPAPSVGPPAATTTTATSTLPTTALNPGLWAGPPDTHESAEYASLLGLTVDEVQRRNGLVESFLGGDLADWLDRLRAFYWVEETPDDWQLVIGRTRVNRRFVEKLEERIAGTPLEDLVEVRMVKHDFQDLQRIQARTVTVIDSWCLPPATSFEIDYVGNRMVLGVQSAQDFAEALDAIGISFGEDNLLVAEHRVEAPQAPNTEPCEAPWRALVDAQARWASHDMTRYAYHVTASSAWVGSVEVGEVLVWNDEVTEILAPDLAPGDPFYPPQFGIQYGTVERLFAIIESNPVQWMSATYDSEFGFPTSIRFNDPTWIDAGWGLQIDGFRVLASAPEPVPPRQSSREDGSLIIETRLPWEIVIVDAAIGTESGLVQVDNGWRYSLNVTSIVYRSPGADPIEVGTVEVVDRVGIAAPRALLQRDGESARLMLTHGTGGEWRVFAVMESTPDGLQLDGPLTRHGYSEEIGYLCHYPRNTIPTDPPPQRNAPAELDLLIRWLDERGVFDPKTDPDAVSKEALRRACEQR